MASLTPGLAAAFARAALANVTREYPRKLDHLLAAAPGDLTPHTIHPAFYGSYDWHSAVHMHWLLVRVLRNQPGLAEAPAIVRVLDAHLGRQAIAAERAYFEAPGRRTFERPYGWAWLLELQAETLRLARDREDARRWAAALQPLAGYLAGRMRAFLAEAPYPIRSGMHPSTAFACILALDYARVAEDRALAAEVGSAARRWHLADRNAPLAYEPSLADFLSPALTEAQLMREVLPPNEFRPWLDAFLPAGLGPLATPPVVPDRTDAQFAHLDGLSLSRAWALRRLGDAVPGGASAADAHLGAGLPQATGGDYVGEHWLASFAALALGDVP
ncbi:MAG: DUF2891 domain-containing protein [Proteobacteria bacterium]|nr:DUF2891 domain-containing protein [Pseudomonadota bacterium]